MGTPPSLVTLSTARNRASDVPLKVCGNSAFSRCPFDHKKPPSDVPLKVYGNSAFSRCPFDDKKPPCDVPLKVYGNSAFSRCTFDDKNRSELDSVS